MKTAAGKLALMACVSFMVVPISATAVNYSTDDGTATSNFTLGTPGYRMNAFQVQPGGENIVSMSIAFWNVSPTSAPFDIVLITDPTTNDGDPSDGFEVVASRASVLTPATITTGAFVDYTFATPTALNVGDWFFAAYDDGVMNIAGATDSSGGTLSWESQGATIPGTVRTFASIGFGDGMIRAVGVPEPSSGMLAAFGMLLLGSPRRRR